ncbi:serine/threonine-protein kinase [Arthrobacter stackebrandtii]|uniref:non-specific serine/threonine protein kinase n=1 Tax=Arthrobacter stackebrandtii TaxID=272161 RepID=A0ABS4YV49_9MICC|nr:Stk1 family PASTA domain-containing Ser/Thr kinase [Arthrobacter stackebrandtii]MBP2412674.1 serine/threonine-protein kinase [Arthrobacter stackebrandtii]PYG98894.1 Stk1 family PASTA domain-containing Ser/Thr kinase [Arthrobacter stackebrandtii]
MSVPGVLNDRYEIGELLGRGGMADVYKAQDTRLGRAVAVKLLRADVARDSQLQARFRREAQAVAGLNHPFIVAVYDTGEHITNDHVRDSAHLPYIVMEYIHGRTLRDLIRSKDINIEQAVNYTMGVLAALDYSHRAGIVHRDIKPANVMVTEDDHGVLGQVKVMDFGIARTIADSAATMTQTQTVMGTAQYLSPEQARGENVDARSDLYSAACLLYEMLAGRPPFTGDSPFTVAYQHVREHPALPSSFNPEISPALDALLMRALEKDRANRFQDAAAFRRALRAASAGVMPPEPRVSQAPIPAAARLPSTGVVSPSPSSVLTDDDGPSTRAMAKELAGGALTTNDGGFEEVPDVPPSTKRRRTAWMVTLFILLAAVLGGGAYLGYNLLQSRPPAVQPVAVPFLVNSPESEALNQLRDVKLEPHSTEEYSATVTAGQVIRTDPAGGTSLNPGSTVQVYVSKGPSTVTIPEGLAGRTDADVRALLSSLNLKIMPNDMVNDGSIAATLVVTTDPAPGETVPAGSSITMKVSNGEILMPSLFDLTDDPEQVKEVVTAALKAVSPFLEVTFSEAENTVVTPGLVTGQSISAGTTVPQRTTVNVTLAAAPVTVEPPAAEPTPEPTPKAKASEKAQPTATPDPPAGDSGKGQ